MKVLCVSAFCPHGRADSAGVLDVHHMLRYLGARHEITLVCGITQADREHLSAVANVARLVAVEVSPMRPLWRYAVRSAGSLLGPLPAIAALADGGALAAALRDVVRNHRFEVAHFAFTQTMHLRALLPPGLRAVVDESDVAFERRRRYAATLRNPIARALLSWDCAKLERYELRWLSRFEGVLLRTQREVELLRARTRLGRVLVMPPWVDVSFRDQVHPEPGGRDILFFGALWRPVNADAARWMARQVFPLVRARVPDARLIIAGSRPPAAVCALQEDHVEVVGWVDSPAPYYQRSAVVVAPLRAGSGIKGKVLQALGVGRPVVATPVGAEGIDATERDGLFVRHDAAALADAIATLLEAGDGARWYQAGRAYFDRAYDFEKGCRAWEALLEELADGGEV